MFLSNCLIIYQNANFKTFITNCPTYEQKPNLTLVRKALDDIVFDALGLTEEERKEVYWAVAELVKNRLEKARNIVGVQNLEPLQWDGL